MGQVTNFTIVGGTAKHCVGFVSLLFARAQHCYAGGLHVRHCYAFLVIIIIIIIIIIIRQQDTLLHYRRV